jgi:hypothetical protein
MMHRVPGGKERMKALHDHPDPTVRWLVADALRSMQGLHGLDYDRDAPVLRKLMVESNSSTRMPAVRALEGFGRLEAADREALQEVIRMDGDGAAAHYARELLAKYP